MGAFAWLSTPGSGGSGVTSFIQAASYGAAGDGVTDNTIPLQQAISAANAAGGGAVYLGAGNFLTGSLTLYSNVHLYGDGIGATTLTLKAGTNGHLLWGGAANDALIAPSAASGSGSTGGLFNWGLHDLTLDGNKANQTAGPSFPLHLYGYGFTLDNVRIRNGYSGGYLTDWNGGASSPGNDSMEAHINGLKSHDNNGIGFFLAGPHDSNIVNLESYNNTSHGVMLGVHSNGATFTNSHSWGNGQGATFTAWLFEATATCVNCVAEGATSTQVVLLANNINFHGDFFGVTGAPSTGIQFGQQAGLTPFDQSSYQSAGLTTARTSSGATIIGFANNLVGANGVFYFANDGGKNLIDVTYFGSSGSLWSGTIASNSKIEGSYNGFTNAPGGLLMLAHNSALAYEAATNLQAPASGGTITIASVTNRVAPAGAITGVILTAGILSGQVVTIINESAFSITFAAAATSHVADGASDVIAATTARQYCWDASTSLWYRLA